MATNVRKLGLLLLFIIPVVTALQVLAIWAVASVLQRDTPTVLAEAEPARQLPAPKSLPTPQQTFAELRAVGQPAAAAHQPPDATVSGDEEPALTEPVPAAQDMEPPLETAPVEAAEAQAPPAEAVVTEPPPAEPSAGLQDAAWVQQRNPARFTLQVETASSPERLEAFASRHDLPQPQAYYRTVWGSSSRYVYALVVGDYPDSQTALAAARELDAGQSKLKPWMRSFGEIQGRIQ